MFFSTDSLTSNRSSPLAIIWLAATLGPKHSYKKLSKKEIGSVSVTAACKYLVSPDEPMALRLTANLMMGVSRVFKHQTDFLYVDCNSVLLNFKKAFKSVKSDHLDLTVSEAKLDAITIPERLLDQLVVLGEEGVFKIPHSLSQQTPGWHRDGSISSLSTSHSMAASSPLSAIASSSFLSRVATASEKSISLAEPPQFLSHHSFDTENSLMMENGSEMDLGFFDDLPGDILNRRVSEPSGAHLQELSEGLSSFEFQSDQMVPETVAIAPKRVRKRKGPIIDDQIALTDNEMIHMRELAELELEEQSAMLYTQLLRHQNEESWNQARQELPFRAAIMEYYTNSTPRTAKRIRLMDTEQPADFQTDNYQPELTPIPEVGRADEIANVMPWHAPSSLLSALDSSSAPLPSINSTPLKGLPFDFPAMPSSASDSRPEKPFFEESSLATDDVDQGRTQETNSFLSYVQGIMRAAQSDSVHLSDLLRDQGGRIVAAQAFYNILTCAHQGLMHPVQEGSDIRIVL